MKAEKIITIEEIETVKVISDEEIKQRIKAYQEKCIRAWLKEASDDQISVTYHFLSHYLKKVDRSDTK